jgi:hypothetical protein
MSDSSVAIGCFDGAHSSAMPLVPWAMVSTGRPPGGASPGGTNAVPVTTIGSPSSDSDTYMIRQPVASPTSRSSTGS